MTAAIIADLVLRLGPVGLDLAQKLAGVWSKPALTPDEVNELCAPARKSYDYYRREIVGSGLPAPEIKSVAQPLDVPPVKA